jgi:alpha-glucuronidase
MYVAQSLITMYVAQSLIRTPVNSFRLIPIFVYACQWVDPCSNYGFSNYSYDGLGCDRTTSAAGTGYAAQYARPVRKLYEDLKTCPTELLLWFHHLEWGYPMRKGNRTIPLIEYINETHFEAVEEAKGLAASWDSLKGAIDKARFEGVQARFAQQVHDAAVMRDSVMRQYSSWHQHHPAPPQAITEPGP